MKVCQVGMQAGAVCTSFCRWCKALAAVQKGMEGLRNFIPSQFPANVKGAAVQLDAGTLTDPVTISGLGSVYLKH